MAVLAQALVVAVVDPNLTVPEAPKLVPLMATDELLLPQVGTSGVVVVGGPLVTVKLGLLVLFWQLTVTWTAPVEAPEGTATTIEVALQEVGVAAVPLKVMVLLPWV